MVDVPQVSQPNALANLQSLATIGQNFGRDQYYNALAKKDADTQAQAEQLRGLDPSTFQTPEGYAKAFAANPEYALKIQQHFDLQSDREQKEILRAAPITSQVMSLVNDQDSYDRALTELQRQKVDTSDFPKQYDPKAVGFIQAGTRHLSEGFAPTAEGGIGNAPGYVAARAAQQFAVNKAAAQGTNAGVGPATAAPDDGTKGWQLLTVPASKDADGNDVPEHQIRYRIGTSQATDLAGNPVDISGNVTKLGAKGAGNGGREATMLGRIMLSATEASKDLGNIVAMPTTADSGYFGGRKQGPSLFDAGKEALTNTLTSQDVQSYNVRSAGIQRALAAIEANGLAPSGSLSHQMDAVIFKAGDTQQTKMEKLAQTRQIVEAGMETILANPRVSNEEKDHVQKVLGQIQKAVPFTIADVDRLGVAQQTKPNTTMRDIMPKPGVNADDLKKLSDDEILKQLGIR